MPSADDALRVSLGRARIEALSRDPESAWIYWEVTADAVRRAIGDVAEIPRIELHIRTRPADSEPIVTMSYVLDHWVDGRFVTGLKPGMPYDAVLVVSGEAGERLQVAATSLKRSPRDSAGRGEPTFAKLSRADDGAFELEVVDHTPPLDTSEPPAESAD